jgi:hypothetical protein
VQQRRDVPAIMDIEKGRQVPAGLEEAASLCADRAGK